MREHDQLTRARALVARARDAVYDGEIDYAAELLDEAEAALDEVTVVTIRACPGCAGLESAA